MNLRPSLLSALASVVDQIAAVLVADKEQEGVNELTVSIDTDNLTLSY